MVRCGFAMVSLSAVLALVVGDTNPARSALSGTSGTIVFVSNRAAKGYELWLSPGNGEGITRLNRRGFSPKWSPDGRRIAFVDYPDGTDGEIFVMDARGRNTRRLTRNRADDSNPTWSPDGSQILFVKARGAPGEARIDLYLMRANGASPRRLTRTRLCEVDASWSPDGSRIAFTHLCGGGTPSLYVMNRDGSGVRRLATWGGSPAWSPDGLQLAFSGASGITVANADGSSARRIAAGSAPTWSPDGRELAFVRVEFTSAGCTVSRIFAVNVEGANERRVTPRSAGSCGADDYQPDWQARCTIYGTTRRDDLSGTSIRDMICALAGSDAISAGGGDDAIIGGDGRDVIDGGPGSDWLFGSGGDDLIEARDGMPDIVDGGPGRDRARLDHGLDRVAGVERLLP